MTLSLWLFGLFLVPLVFASAGIHTVSIEDIAPRAQAIVIGTVSSPATQPHSLPVPGEGCAPYATQTMHLTVTSVLRPHGGLAEGPLVVFPAYSGQLISLEQAACAGGPRKIPLWDRVSPAPAWAEGETVAVLLRQVDGRWELLADGSWLVGAEATLRSTLAAAGVR